MAKRSTLILLAEDVEQLTEPSLEIDRQIFDALIDEGLITDVRIHAWLIDRGDDYPECTASVDDRLKLAASVLPGWVCLVCTYGFRFNKPFAEIYKEGHAARVVAYANMPSIALAAGLLWAAAE